MRSSRSLSWAPLVAALLVLLLALARPAHANKRQDADAADKHIVHVPVTEVNNVIKQDTWIVMFGAQWCGNTQALTPKWLKLQERFLAAYPTASSTTPDSVTASSVHLTKVECSIPNEPRSGHPVCDVHAPDGFPTVNLYVDGKLVEEYPGNNEVEDMLRYVDVQVVQARAKQQEEALVEAARIKAEEEEEEKKKKAVSKVAASPSGKAAVAHGESAALAQDVVSSEPIPTTQPKTVSRLPLILGLVAALALVSSCGVALRRARRRNRQRSVGTTRYRPLDMASPRF
ncbi:hypothetical protein HKX48_001371 [Thoreauomyces humboldtii]|nr:hypothetical protein HKX48_001371 [Thoreauomyces humboldtii]